MNLIRVALFALLLYPVISCSKTTHEAENSEPPSRQFSFSNDVANTSKNGTKAVRLLDAVSTTAELARKINAGEKNAYQELFEKYAPRIYQLSLSYMKNSADAEELNGTKRQGINPKLRTMKNKKIKCIIELI